MVDGAISLVEAEGAGQDVLHAQTPDHRCLHVRSEFLPCLLDHPLTCLDRLERRPSLVGCRMDPHRRSELVRCYADSRKEPWEQGH